MSAYERIAFAPGLPGAATGTRLATIEMHTGGEPVRVIVGGFPDVPGRTILERRRYVKQHLDHLRTALMWEPRGHADMYGVLPLPPERPDSDLGMLFLHNEGYSTMCGHATLAMAKLVIDAGWVDRVEPVTTVRFDAPCGQLTARVGVAGGRVKSVEFDNVPSFVAALEESVDVPGLGRVRYDLAFGGAFYAYVDAASVGLACTPERYRDLIDTGMRIKRAVMATSTAIVHPAEPDLSFLYGTIFVEPSGVPGVHSRNVCVFADGEVDRSATGSGVSGRAAIHHARGELAVGETITIESIVGSCMTVRVRETTTFGGRPAVIPTVGGMAHYAGRAEFLIDPEDPLRGGFLLR